MSDIQKYIQFLQIHPPFNQMTVDLLEKIASAIKVKCYGVGQTIFRKGEEAQHFYIINTGMVREVIKEDSGEETAISILKSGECFGAISLLTEQQRMLDAVAEEDVELYVINKPDLSKLLSEYPAMNTYFNRTLTQKLNMFFEYFNREKIKFVDKEKLALDKEKELAVIDEIAKLMSSEEVLEHQLFQAVDVLKAWMKADACSLFLLDNLSDRLVLKASSGYELPVDKAIEMNSNEGITGWVVRNGEPVSLENVEKDPRVKFIPEIYEERFKSLLSVPLMAAGETFGAMNFQTKTPRKYKYEEIQGMTIAGGQIAMIFHNAMLKKRLETDFDTLHTEKRAVPEEFIGKSPLIKRINKFITKVADSDKPILLEGDDGTGKELLARLTHSSGPRINGPFVEVDCGFFNRESWGEELFGLEEERKGLFKVVRHGFIEKADGGILFLKNVEKLNGACQVKLFNFLQTGLFNRVGNKMQQRANVQIISTCTIDFKTVVLEGSFNKNTYEALKRFEFKMEPLRKRRRDIPELSNYLLKRIGRQIHKESLSLSESANKRLLAYDWPGNVSELDNVLKGAAILSKGKTIGADLLFFPSRTPEDKLVYNLFRHSWLSNLLKGKLFPEVFGKTGLMVFTLTLFFLFAYPQNNLLNSGIWSLGWALIFFITLLFGRIFCAVCPFMVAGEAVRNYKCFNMDRPGLISRRGESVGIFFIFVIFWIEGAFGFENNPIYTALLLLSITSGAIICALLFQRRVWCRYLCPMGSLLGIFSLTSFFFVNADKHVCMYRCSTHDCYTGTGDKPGCQLFLHPYGIESQQHCVICVQCHKNCPYASVKLNLQFPSTGILAVAGPSLVVALASTALLGILPVESGGLFAPGNVLFDQLMESYGIRLVVLYTITFLSAAVVPSLIILVIERFLGGYNFKKSIYRFTRFGYSLLPMALLGHISFYGKKTILWLEGIVSQTAGGSIDFFSANLVFYGVYSIAILAGVAGSVNVFIRITKRDPVALRTSKKLMCGYVTLIGFYTVLYFLVVL